MEAPPNQMKASQLCGFNQPYALRTKPVPQIGADELLIRVHAAGWAWATSAFSLPAPWDAGPSLSTAGPRGAGSLPKSPAHLQPDLVIDSTAAGARDRVLDYTHGGGVAVAVVCTDSLAANEWALGLLRIGGTLVLLGLPPEKWRFDASPIVFREPTLKGSYVASRGSTERLLAVVEESGVRSHLTVVPFEDVAGVIDAYQDKALKARRLVVALA